MHSCQALVRGACYRGAGGDFRRRRVGEHEATFSSLSAAGPGCGGHRNGRGNYLDVPQKGRSQEPLVSQRILRE